MKNQKKKKNNKKEIIAGIPSIFFPFVLVLFVTQTDRVFIRPLFNTLTKKPVGEHI